LPLSQLATGLPCALSAELFARFVCRRTRCLARPARGTSVAEPAHALPTASKRPSAFKPAKKRSPSLAARSPI